MLKWWKRWEEKDKKDKKDRENHWGNKVNLVIEKDNNSKTSIYHHIIYKY